MTNIVNMNYVQATELHYKLSSNIWNQHQKLVSKADYIPMPQIMGIPTESELLCNRCQSVSH